MHSMTLADRLRLRKDNAPAIGESGTTAAANRRGSSAAAAQPTFPAQVGVGEESAGSRRLAPVGRRAHSVPAMEGTAQIKGEASWVGDTRLTLGQLLLTLADRRSATELLQRFPRLDPQDIRDAVDYAAQHGLLD